MFFLEWYNLKNNNKKLLLFYFLISPLKLHSEKRYTLFINITYLTK